MRAGLDVGWCSTGLAAAWLAGVAVHLQQPEIGAASHGAVVAAAGALALAAGSLGSKASDAPERWAGSRWVALAVAMAGAALAAFGASNWRAAERLAEALPPALEGRDLSVTGVVASLPQRGASGTRFRFEVESAASNGEPVRLPSLLALGWYRGAHEDAADGQPRGELRAGQRWRLTLRLRQPHGNLNPHGFDYELYLFEQGLRATGYVRDAPPPHLLDRAAGYPVERLRQRVRDAIEASVANRRAAGVLTALAVGDQGAIDREDWDLYRATGIAHLVSISGLHITMFAWLAGLGIAALWRRSTRAMLWWPTPLAACWGGVLCAAGYAVFSGWGVPSQRTVWMLVVVALTRSFGVRWPWLLVLLLAAVVVTAFDPWALLQPGFWLSFVAVGLLMASSQRPDAQAPASRPPGWRGWLGGALAVGRGALRTQAVATIGLAPLALVFFQQVSLVGFAANIVAIPLVTLVITPLALLGVLVAPLWGAGAWVVQQLDTVLGWLAALPGAVWSVAAAPVWAQVAGLAGAVLLTMPLPWRARLLALGLIAPLALPAPLRPAAGEFELLVLDVGQGTSVIVRTATRLLVYDAGPQYSRESDAGQRVLLPLLRALGEPRIDTLVLSHRDTDHVGGAGALLKALAVGDVLSSLEPGHPLIAASPHHTRCRAGQSWLWDGVRFDLLRPAEADYERALKSNAMSCVLRIEGGGRSVLLTGDIEREQEAALVAAAPEALRSDVLLVPHHGSRTSSSAAFLDAVKPTVAVVQAGYRNRFGHPAPDVMARYRARSIDIQASPRCGAWHWNGRVSPQGVCWRTLKRRYWHHDAAAQ